MSEIESTNCYRCGRDLRGKSKNYKTIIDGVRVPRCNDTVSCNHATGNWGKKPHSIR